MVVEVFKPLYTEKKIFLRKQESKPLESQIISFSLIFNSTDFLRFFERLDL